MFKSLVLQYERGFPVPFLRLRGETEWTRPVEAEFRHLELLGSTGARWLFSDELRLSAGLGIGGEVLQPEANAPLTADLAFEVLKLPITHWSDMPLLLEGRMDVNLFEQMFYVESEILQELCLLWFRIWQTFH